MRLKNRIFFLFNKKDKQIIDVFIDYDKMLESKQAFGDSVSYRVIIGPFGEIETYNEETRILTITGVHEAYKFLKEE